MRGYNLDNQHDFKVNLRDDFVRRELEKFKTTKGIPLLCPLFKNEIKEFEAGLEEA